MMVKKILSGDIKPTRLQSFFCAAFGAVALFIAVGAAPASSEHIAIIVHRDNPINSITRAQLKKYYSDIITAWPDNTHIKVYDLPIKDTARRVFSDKVLHKLPEIVTMEWANKRITNTAKNPTSTVRSQKVMLMKVSKDKTAIGYLPVKMVKKSLVKVILVIE